MFSLKSRENVLEILLVNHPLDCPICDQAGECDLQEQIKSFGSDFSRFFLTKRGVIDKKCGPIIKTIMTRCIHCTRCVRFTSLIDGLRFGILNRGTASEIGLYNFKQECGQLLANVIDLCPVGALTARLYAFKARPWELKITESLDLSDGLGSNIHVTSKGVKIFRITPKSTKSINGNILSDRCRYSQSFDLKIPLEEVYNYCETEKKYVTVSWFTFLKTKFLRISEKKTVHILVSVESSLENLIYLKSLSNVYCNNIIVHTLKIFDFTFNKYFYIFDALNVIEKKIVNCFLFVSNPKVEILIFNFKLKIKYQKSLLSVFSFCGIFASTVKTTYLNLHPSNICLFVEAKNKKLANFLLREYFSLFVFGSLFLEVWSPFIGLVLFLKKQLLTLKTLKLNKFCNEENFSLLGLKSNIKRKSLGFYFCVDLYDNLSLHKNILMLQMHKVWFNSVKPLFCSDYIFNFLIPIYSFLEEPGIFINLENRFQKTKKVFNSLSDKRGIIYIFESLYFTENLFFSLFLRKVLFDLLVNSFKLSIIFKLCLHVYTAKEKIQNLPSKLFV